MSVDNEVDLTLWEPLPSIPKPEDFRGYAATTIRDTVYISGGLLGSALDSRGEGKSVVQNTLFAYNMESRQWMELPKMKYCRWGHRLVGQEGGRFLFAIGGWGRESPPEEVKGGKKDKNGGKKDPLKENGAPKKEKRRSGMPFFGRKKKVDDDDDVVEEIIRRAPLSPEQAPQDTSTSTSEESSHEDAPLERLTAFEVYDTSKHVWKTAGHLNESRRDFAAVVDPTSGKIYAFGGTSADKSASRTAEVYNPHTNSWTYLAEMPDRKRWCHALQVGQRIHVFETGKRTLTYDILSNSWSYDEPDDSFIPKCPPNGKICASAAFASSDKLASGATLVVYGYPVREMDGRLADRWMVTLIGNRRSKSWTVLPPADEFMYYRVVVANGKLVICAGNGMIAFQVVEEGGLDDISTVAGSLTASEKGSWRSAGSGGKLSSISKRSLGKSSRADTHSTSGSGTDRIVEVSLIGISMLLLMLLDHWFVCLVFLVVCFFVCSFPPLLIFIYTNKTNNHTQK